MLVADTYNSKIKLVNPLTNSSTAWAGVGNDPDPSDEGLRLDQPGGLSLAVGNDNVPTLFVADTNNHRVVRIDPASGAHTVITFKGLTRP